MPVTLNSAKHILREDVEGNGQKENGPVSFGGKNEQENWLAFVHF